MRKVVLYIAQSLDGKIAKPNGDIKWLEEMPYPENEDYGYAAFLETVDTVIMGKNTYRQIKIFGIEYPYSSKASYVFTRNSLLKNNSEVNFICSNIITLCKQQLRDKIDGCDQTVIYLLLYSLMESNSK